MPMADILFTAVETMNAPRCWGRFLDSGVFCCISIVLYGDSDYIHALGGVITANYLLSCSQGCDMDPDVAHNRIGGNHN